MAKKILIIDDEPDVVSVLGYRLKAKGYEVVSANDGQTGVEVARAERPDLIIIDYRLPDSRAAEVIRKVKADEALKDVPVILMTASVESINGKAKECSAVDHISKPVDPQELYEKVARWLGL